MTVGLAELIEEPEAETEEVAAEWQAPAIDTADEGMGSNETGGVGSHELSSLASAVATDQLEEEWVPEPVEYEPAPVQVAEARPEPEPAPYAARIRAARRK